MQYFIVSVMLAGDRNQIVANKGPVSVPEIAVLRHIHGDTAVMNLRFAHTDKTASHTEIREQLRTTYENATPGQREAIVDKLFSTMGKLPTALDAIGIDGKAEAAKLRAQADEAAKAAEAMLSQLAEAESEDDIDLTFLGDEEADAEPTRASRKAA